MDQEKQAPPASGNNSRQREIKMSVVKAVCITVGLALAIIGLYFLSQFNYLFFHTTVEVFSIVIAFAIFAIGWNSRRIINNNYLVVISVAFLFVGGLALLHSLTYRGMNVFEGIDANWATQLWIAMRYLLSLSLVFALVFIRKKLNPWVVLAVFSVIFILLVGSIFFWQVFPVAYIGGQGLTTFKVVSEYVISGIFVFAILLLFRNSSEFSGNVKNYLVAAMVALIAAELSFTLYIDVYGFFNLAGHLLNLVAFYLIYKAIIETGLSRPHDLLFFNIKKHEETLKKSEERFRGALDNMIEGCQIIGRDWRYIYINDAAERHNRRSRTELLGNRYMDMWPGIESTNVFRKIKECMETSISLSIENFFVYPDGKTGWFELRINPIPEGVFILSMDVTERKNAEEAITSGKRMLESVFDNMYEGIFILDRTGKVVDFNTAFITINKFNDRNDVLKSIDSLGKVFRAYHLDGSFVPLEEWPAAKALRGEFGTNQEYIVERIDLGVNWITSNSYAPLRDENEQIIGAIQTFHDITERKKAEQALKISEERSRQRAEELQNLMDIIPIAVWLSNDPECKFIVGNQTANSFYEASIGENVSAGSAEGTEQDFTRRFFRNGKELMPNELPMQEAVANNKEIKNTEIDVLLPSGKSMTMLGSAKPLLNDKGKVRGCLATFIDITERKESEEALKQAQAQLEVYAKNLEFLVEERTKALKDSERLAAIGATAGMVGHDIRNPLQAITGDLYFARRDLAKLSSSLEKQKIVENLSSIETSVNYINKIVQDLQDFARPIKPTIQETDVDALCKELMQQTKHLPTVSTNCQVDESLKKMPVDGLILRRILTNLVTNAIQAMPEGGNVTLEAYKEGNNAVITVTDTGSGIPDDVKPKLFTPLMTTKSKGQGFGLAVVKRMTEALGGSVSFESEVGKGTKFIIRLPLKE